MNPNKRQFHQKTDPSFFNSEETKELPIAFNTSCTNYCSLRVKKRFIDRYFLSKQISQNCRKQQLILNKESSNRQIRCKTPFEVSPIKIHENSPDLIRERIKTEYPKVRIFRHQRKENLKSVYKTITVQFLQKKILSLPKDKKFKITKLPSTNKQNQGVQMKRPMTANAYKKLSSKASNFRRTKTMEISNLTHSSNGKCETNYSINGWQNQIPEYDA